MKLLSFGICITSEKRRRHGSAEAVQEPGQEAPRAGVCLTDLRWHETDSAAEASTEALL